jgi:chromosomal replication initiation ATPase DnaA
MTQAAPRQLPLPFVHAPVYAADFVAARSNEAALVWLDGDPAQWPLRRLALWGEEGSGKTHLLHRWAAATDADLIDGAGLRLTPPQRAVAIDDADAAPERMLLHLLNAAAEAGLPVLLAARPPPARWPVLLPDLASRLRATTAVELRPAEDDLLRTLLMRLLAERQIAVSEPLQGWLLRRLPRSAGALREAAARLDRAALAAGGRVTRPVAAAVVAKMQAEQGVEGPDDEDCAQPAGNFSPAAPGLL